jgi:transcriptional regulator
MYIPPAFAQTDRARLWDFVEAHSFALVVSCGDGRPLATHMPLVPQRDVAPLGRLLGHVARANEHWKSMAGREVLCVFSGPHAYVSPSWYEAESVVPTWNYVAVHLYGTCRIVEEKSSTAEILARYVELYERPLEPSWTLDTSTRFFDRLVEMVVGFHIDVTRVEGKWKLSQNHPRDRQEKVAARLAQQADENSRQIARLMRESLSGS